MAAISITDLGNIIQKIIRPAVEDQLYAKTILWNMIGGFNPKGNTKQTRMPNLNWGILKTSMDNNSYYIPTLTGHSSGAVAIPENGTLVPGKPNTNAATVSARYQTGTFQITKQVLSIKEAGVAIKQLDFYMSQNTLAMVLDLNRQGYGDGTGTVGTAASSVTSTTLVFAASTNGDIDYAAYTPVGTNLIIGGNAMVTVTAVTGVNTVTISSSQTWTAGAAIKKTDGAGNAAVEIDGLAEAVSNTLTYQGINPATDTSWKPGYVNIGAPTGLSLADMNTAFVKGNRLGNIKFVIMNASLFAKYGGLLTPNMRFDYKDVLGGGWKGLDFMGGQASVVLDYDCPDDKVYFISPDSFTLGELSPFDWEQGTSGVLLRVQGTLNYEVTGTWFGNLGCFKRSANSVLTLRN